MIKRLLCVILTLMIALSCGSCISPSRILPIDDDGAKLIVHFIDVGQGDCTLLESDDEFVLIDGGDRNYGREILTYIENRGADELKYVIATHPHSDHVGGLPTVIDGIDVGEFITAPTDCDTYTWHKVVDTVERNRVRTTIPSVGQTYTFGQATLTVMGPKDYDTENENNISIVSKVICGDISFLFTGDAERASEAETVDMGGDLSADVYKCGHHGASDASCDKLMKAVDPAFAIASCGRANEYNHPHRQTRAKLQTMGVPLFITYETGTILALTDGKSLRFHSEKADLSAYTFSSSDRKPTADALKYIGNKNSLVFHFSDCESVADMKEKNKVFFDTRDEAVSAGYTPCPGCQP